MATTAAGMVGSTMLGKLLAAKAKAPGIRVGVCDWSIGVRGPAALDTARKIGLNGLEVSPMKAAKTLSYSADKVQGAYKAKVAETGVVISSLAITVLNQCPLATDPRGLEWLDQTIDAAHGLGAKVILLAFFGAGDLLTRGKAKGGKQGRPGRSGGLNDKAVVAVVERLKVAAPKAVEKGVILGLENTLSAKQNMKIIEAVGHQSVQVYYDIANSTRGGYDVPGEIRMLADKICQFHFKDNKGAFDSGNPKMGPIIEAVKDIKYKGWIVLERAFGKDKAAYFTKNAGFVRKAFGLKPPTYQRPGGVQRQAVTNSVGMRLVYVPAGEFIMGSPTGEKGRHADEKQRRVKIAKGFHVAATEVTQAQWQAVMGFNPSKTKGANLPVHGVSWSRAVEFCRKLSAKERKTYRLPTEAEWEYACRAGSAGPFAGDADKVAWHMDSNGERPRPVATTAPNAWGIHDMHGNAMEWTSDKLDDGPPTYVARGGSWRHFRRACRSAARTAIRPSFGMEYVGFRVVMD